MLTSKCALRFEPATSKISLSLYSKQLQIPRSPLFGEARTREKMVSFLVEKYIYVCLMKNTIYSGASTKNLFLSVKHTNKIIYEGHKHSNHLLQ